jgi:hypothetical protein
MSTCKHGNTAPTETINALHVGQEGVQRHKCCECAFERGVDLGRIQAIEPGGNALCTYTQRRAPAETIDALPESQGTVGRHKCAVCAFHEGFARGRALATAG